MREPYYSHMMLSVATLIAMLSFVCLSYISFFESEFFSLTASEVAQMKISSNPRFDRLKTLSENPLETLGAVIISRYFTIVISLVLCSLVLAQSLWSLPCGSFYIYLIICIILLFLMFIFVELIPDEMVKKDNPFTICRGATVIAFFGFIFKPFVLLIVNHTHIVNRRLESRTQRSATIDDISDSLNADSADEKELLRGMVEFGKTNVDEIMQPRVDIVDIDYKSDFETVMKIIRESEYSRLPVYDDSIDYVKGILYIKDFLKYTDQSKDFKWQKLIREPYFVPENKKIDDLLKEFQQKHIHMAIVVDEFGGTAGIVTMEDIIEVIVGDICDEHDEEEDQINRLDDFTYILNGKLLLSDFYRLDEVDKEEFEAIEGDADTLAGLILEIKGYIPTKGEEIEVGKYKFEIFSADKRRIKEIKFSIKNEE